MLNGGGSDQRIDRGQSGSCGTAQFNGFQTEIQIYRDDLLKERQVILPLLLTVRRSRGLEFAVRGPGRKALSSGRPSDSFNSLNS